MNQVSIANLRRAVVTAGHRGDYTTVLDAMAHSEPEIRCVALGALERTGYLNQEILERAFSDEAASVRIRALKVAATRTEYFPALLSLLTDPEDTVVEVAAFALGECVDAPLEAVEALCVVATEHNDSLCRESATAALGSIGHPTGLPAVVHACGDKAAVRRRAVLALAAFDGSEVTDMLRSMTSDRDLQVRQSAQELLDIETGENL
ncbi:MAG: HEAT repeat domain-containing protein [Microthrixaceae bacterium]|nr:HEAT repeat domain-containing protein [Microthrixaceae bacterium]